MATLDSVDLYMGLSSARSGWNVVVSVYAFANYSISPNTGSLLGSKAIDVSNVPLVGDGPDWVNFTFDTPIDISSEAGWIGVHVTTTAPDQFARTPLRWYKSSEFDASAGPPSTGKEHYWYYSFGAWTLLAITGHAYKLNTTDCDSNDALTPNASYRSFGAFAQQGIRSYLNTTSPSVPVIIRSVKLGANGAFIVVAAKDGIYLSTDSGDNWSRKTPDAVEDTDWEKGICSSDGTYIIVVSDANAIYRSANSGSSWAEITPAGGDTFSVNKMATSDDGQFMVMVGQNSTDATESCYISTDYGATWTTKKPVAASIEYTECDISNDGTVIAVSTTEDFFISLDSGATWKEQGMASTAEVWKGLSISGDGTTGLVANTNNNDEFFIGINTELFSEATWAESTITSAGRALIDDATVADQNTTLGFGTGDSPTLTGLTLSGLTETRIVLAHANGVLADDADLTFVDDTLFGVKGTFSGVLQGGDMSTIVGAVNTNFTIDSPDGAECVMLLRTDQNLSAIYYNEDLPFQLQSSTNALMRAGTPNSGGANTLMLSVSGTTFDFQANTVKSGALIIPDNGFIGSASVPQTIHLDSGDATFTGSASIDGELFVDDDTHFGNGISDTTTINNAYILPQDEGPSGFLVNTTGTGDAQWGYVDPASLSVALAAEVTVADESSDTTCFPAFFTAATGGLPIKTDADGLTYNSLTKSLGIGGDLTLTDGSIFLGTDPLTFFSTFPIGIDVSSYNDGTSAIGMITDQDTLDIYMETSGTGTTRIISISKVGDNLALQRIAGSVLIGTSVRDGKLTIAGDGGPSGTDRDAPLALSVTGGAGFPGQANPPPNRDGGKSGGIYFETVDGADSFASGGDGGAAGTYIIVLGVGGTGFGVDGADGFFSVGDGASNNTVISAMGSITQEGSADATLNLTTSSTQTEWDAAHDNMVTDIAFNTGDGIITITQQDSGTLTTDSLDGRYYTETELGSTSNGLGASLLGIEDDMSLYAGTNVEDALEEVMDMITIETHVADSFEVGGDQVGTVTGIVENTQVINDGDELILNETTGGPNPNFVQTFEFSGITTGHEPNLIELHWYYSPVTTPHTISIQMYNYNTSTWDVIDNTTFVATGGTLTFSSLAITDGGSAIVDYTSGGAARVRFSHDDNGISAHDFGIDYLAIKDDHGIGSGITDHGSLSGLQDDDHDPLYHTDGRAATWLAANHETTFTHADIATNTTHTADNSQAHSDYLINNGDDETSGVLTAAGFTVGSMALTDGVITDATGLSFVADTSVTGDFTVNTTDFHVEAALGRVGVGTVNPVNALEVRTTAIGSNFIAVKDTRSNVGDLVGIRFSTSVSLTTNFKSFIAHIETGANGRGDLIFCVDSNSDEADVGIGDEKMRLKSNGDLDLINNFTAGTIQADDGFTGSWVNAQGDTVTVVGGIITSIVSP